MKTIHEIGWGRIGFTGGTIPFMHMSINNQELSVELKIRSSSTRVVFAPDDIIDIKTFCWVPYFAWGIRIYHKRKDCDVRILFGKIENPKKILERIESTGFLDKSKKLTEEQKKSLITKYDIYTILEMLGWVIGGISILIAFYFAQL